MFESLGVINVWTYLVGLFFFIIAPARTLYVLRTGAVRGIGLIAPPRRVSAMPSSFSAPIQDRVPHSHHPYLLFTLVPSGRHLPALSGVKILHANFIAKRRDRRPRWIPVSAILPRPSP